MFRLCCVSFLGVSRPARQCWWPGPAQNHWTVTAATIRCLSGSSCRWESSGSRRSPRDWGSGRFPPEPVLEDLEPENMEQAVEAELQVEKRKRKAVLLQRMRREFEPRGPPERALTWEAIEQIRFLKQESPEEWTVPHLAEGFNVSPDVIRRILKSKFVPSIERRVKQDSRLKAAAAAADKAPKQVTAGNTHVMQLPAGALALSDSQPAVITTGTRSELSKTGLQKEKRTNRKLPALASAAGQGAVAGQAFNIGADSLPLETGGNPGHPQIQKGNDLPDQLSGDCLEPEEAEEHDGEVQSEEEWDGEILGEEELERLAESGMESKMKVVQRGNEFHDSSGTFLYRV